MRTKILTLLALTATVFSCAKWDGYIIKGNLPNLSGKIYLNTYEGKQPVKIDSTEIVDGTFTFKGKLDYAKLASIEAAEGGVATQFFLDNSEVTIAPSADGSEIIVTGSAANDLFNTMKSEEDTQKLVEIVKSNPSSSVAAYVLFRNLSYRLSVPELDELIANFTPEIQQTSYIKILGDRVSAMKRTEVGQPYIDIALPTPEGEVVKLSSLIDSGKYVLVDFWASWCPPCRAENPNVVVAYEKFKDRGFTVYGVSLDRPTGKEDWIAAINKDKLTWTNVSDLKHWNCAPAAEYGVSSIPSNFLISPEGVIVGKNLREETLHTKLEELLPDNKKKK